MKAITVSQLNNYIKQIFEAEELLHNIQVVGEIDGISIRGNAVYFSLRDDGAVIPCVCYFPGKVKGIENGSQVSVRGTVSYWHKAGKISFSVHHIEAFGFGQLFLKFQELKTQLEKEGFFDVGKKKTLPDCPKRIGIITSKQGAVLHDILKVTQRRNSAIDIVLYPVQVQGAGADKSVCEGIDYFSSCKSVDVIIVARGGGSKEDLAAFNTECVARAVFASSVPIVSAVGHETDWTLIDFVSDLRAPTPSAAAEIVVPEVASQKERVVTSWKFIKYLGFQKMGQLTQDTIQAWRDCKDNVVGRLDNVTRNTISCYCVTRNNTISCVEKIESRIGHYGALVEANNPLAVLRRGYARVTTGGHDVLNTGQVKNGDAVEIKMIDGIINAKVEGIRK
ncbi:MAG: exodeoxyribonuclease VII large subunit [Firmicutes bacterium]|nr:exodeoxyribonuclease VII large subunit [Bacillota bacterium]